MLGSERRRRLFSYALDKVNPKLLAWAYRRAQTVPFLQSRIEREYGELLSGVEAELKPYRHRYKTYAKLPTKGLAPEAIVGEVQQLAEQEHERWQRGYVSGAVYHGDPEHVKLLADVYALSSQSNPLHADVWPSTTKYESEIVSMTAHLLGASALPAGDGEEVCGVVTSGGTESILLAMKAYRDRARDQRNIVRPNIVVPESAHAAFDKAAQYFGIERIDVPLGPDLRADVGAMRRAIDENTIALVASAPSFPHGVIDPVPELGELALERGIGLHVDACLGGFILPFARELGYRVTPFDFGVPGVTSMSADTHKYGYAAKGTSVVLYSTPELRRYQYFVATDWPGGLYFSPTLSGSRPGALSAACWAAMLHLGHDGYLDNARRILAAAARLRAGVERIAGLELYGDSLFVVAFGARGFDIYRVLDGMRERGWSLNGLHRPACIHLCVTLRHVDDAVVERFLADLEQSALEARRSNGAAGMAPIYGLAATLPLRGAVADLLKRYVDLLYKL